MILILLSAWLLASPGTYAQPVGFRGAPDSARALRNPQRGKGAETAGAKLFAENCSSCHGQDGGGQGNVPALSRGAVQAAADGELFWFIGVGSPTNGMPASPLPKKQRWQVVSFLKALGAGKVVALPPPLQEYSKDQSPPPNPPFSDYRYERPG